MYQEDREVRSRNDYILGTESRLLQNVAVRDVRHNTDHYLVLGCLCGAEPSAHLRYLGKRTRFPVRPLATPDKVDRMFDELRGSIPKIPRQERQHRGWISLKTWSLIDTRMEARCRKDQRSSRALAHAIKAALQGGRHRRAANVGLAV